MRLFVLIAFTLLAGCSSPSSNDATPRAANDAAASVAPIENAAAADEAEAIQAALAHNQMPPLPKTVATPTKTLPAELVGIWTADKAGKCAPGSELRIEIAPDRITAYESVSRVESVVATWPEGYGVDVQTTGEGRTERRSFDLIPRKDGTLTRSEAPHPDITYTRCPKGA